MTIVKKLSSTEIIAKTNITKSTAIILKEIHEGVDRYITITGIDESTVIREYTKNNDLYQTVNFLVGSKGYESDWNDATADSISVAAGTTRTIWKEIDLGNVKQVILNLKIAANNFYTVGIYVSISDDGVNWTEILSAVGLGSGNAGVTTATLTDVKEFRYLKVEYDNSDTGSQYVYLYTIEIYDNEDDNCLLYKYLSDNKIIEYKVQTDKKLYTVCIFTNNCNYRIQDIDLINLDYTNVGVE